MTAKINVELDVNPQEVYDELWLSEQKRFLLNNIRDLEDSDLISELENRGYNMEGVSK